MAGSSQIRRGDDAIVAGDVLGQRDHQRKGLFGDQNIPLARQRQDGDAPLAARFQIDIREDAAKFLHDGQRLQLRDRLSVQGEAFDDDRIGVGQLCLEIGLILGELTRR